MKRARALVIDDEPDIRELLEITLQRMAIETCSAGSIAEAMAQLEGQAFDLCLADMRLPDGNGIEIVRHMAKAHPKTPVAMISAHGNMQSAIEALKAGAFDFVSKPVDLPMLRRLVETALHPGDPDHTGQTPEAPASQIGLLGQSAAMQEIRHLITKLARSQAPVFVAGESGTGKELASRLIHQSGPRRERPFVAVNCGAIPGELMESELFGHVRGSFTGALQDRQGLFQAAHGGTLFLDEVADLPLSMQVKLLRAIQEKRVRPVGSASETAVDVRLISASHKDLQHQVASGGFRQDLFYRLHVIELTMPPLRDRPEDIPQTIGHILARISRDSGAPTPRLEDAALRALEAYDYPGNVRELENLLERACALCEQGLVRRKDLGLKPARQAAGPTEDLHEGDLEGHLAGVERRLLLAALEATRWNRTAAARKLGLTLRSLRYRLQKLGLEPGDTDGGKNT